MNTDETKLSRKGLYHLGDYHRQNDKDKLRGQWNGEKRCPRKGEWYLSGAKITTYQAKNDLTIEFHIARIVEVKVETIVTTTIVRDQKI